MCSLESSYYRGGRIGGGEEGEEEEERRKRGRRRKVRGREGNLFSPQHSQIHSGEDKFLLRSVRVTCWWSRFYYLATLPQMQQSVEKERYFFTHKNFKK